MKDSQKPKTDRIILLQAGNRKHPFAPNDVSLSYYIPRSFRNSIFDPFPQKNT